MTGTITSTLRMWVTAGSTTDYPTKRLVQETPEQSHQSSLASWTGTTRRSVAPLSSATCHPEPIGTSDTTHTDQSHTSEDLTTTSLLLVELYQRLSPWQTKAHQVNEKFDRSQNP